MPRPPVALPHKAATGGRTFSVRRRRARPPVAGSWIDTDAATAHNGAMPVSFDQPVDLGEGVTLRPADAQWSFARGGGPGGQHVNKTSTRATLSVELDALTSDMPPWALRRLRNKAGSRLAGDPERIVITSAGTRSQSRNREVCIEKLAELVVRSMRRPKRRKPTKPSRAANQRRLDAKKQRGRLKARRSGDSH